MGIHTILLPDIGEGIAEAELIRWHIQLDDHVSEDQVLAEVMTDKASVEVPSAVNGRVVWLGAQEGQMIAIGAKLIQIEVEGDGNEVALESDEVETKKNQPHLNDPVTENKEAPPQIEKFESQGLMVDRSPTNLKGHKPLAAPSVRAKARKAGIDLNEVQGSGPSGRITHADLEQHLSLSISKNDGAKNTSSENGSSLKRRDGTKEIKIFGLRRKIAEKMSLANSRIPHITIVEEVNMSELEDLRNILNKQYEHQRPKLTLMPFLMRALTEAVREQPQFNARYDDDAGVLTQYAAVNIGIATQTESGLTVTVADHAEAASLWENAERVSDLAHAARDGSIKLENLSGSTITISSLGALGAIATTPIINHPEVAIVGINKMQTRPMWDGQQFQPCKMMNISCSFDHRVIDGWDAAIFVQKIKTLLETPAMLFVET